MLASLILLAGLAASPGPLEVTVLNPGTPPQGASQKPPPRPPGTHKRFINVPGKDDPPGTLAICADEYGNGHAENEPGFLECAVKVLIEMHAVK